MFKDYDKYISASLKIYTFLLVIIFILKIVGLDYFGLDVNNQFLINISNYCIKFKIDYIYSYINCFITVYIMASLSLKENSKKLKKFILITMPITIIVKYLATGLLWLQMIPLKKNITKFLIILTFLFLMIPLH